MTQTQIQVKKQKIARVCLILLISTVVAGSVMAFSGEKKNNKRHSLLNTERIENGI